jgi:RNA polymerase sigma factor (sigma-70 family)
LTTQPELPEVAPLPARPLLYVAPPPAESDVDFDGFVRAYEARLRRLVMRRIGDLCEAEEITQETLLRAYQHRASFATEDELMAWSTVVAQRLVIDRVRVRGRSVAVAEVPETARMGRDTADIVVARHEARAALESLEAIPTRQAAILWAREVEGLHYEEIAERFGITEPAVRSLLHRGRKALRKEFKDRTGSLPLNGLVPFAPWLLALKAAGRVRGAAKAAAKSSITAAAALSVSALVVATGIGPNIGTRPVPEMRIDAGRGGATYVTAVRDEAVEAVDRAAVHRAVRSYAVTPTTTTPTGPAAEEHDPTQIKRCVHDVQGRTCVNIDDDIDPPRGGELQLGPDLPKDNPLGLGNLKVASEYIDCDDVSLPSNDVAKCTQRGESTDPTQNAPKPTPEGVLR